jgi:predicted RNase H-like nuclease (RuvC/YqgF family)
MEAHEAQVEAQLQKAWLDAAGNADLKDELERQKAQYSQSLTEATQRWDELKGIRSENTKLKKQLEESLATIQHLKDDLLNRQSEADQLAKTREELAVTRTERDKLQQSLTVRDEDVAWLRGHVAQLTQQLALPPSKEEARAKYWWRFWR